MDRVTLYMHKIHTIHGRNPISMVCHPNPQELHHFISEILTCCVYCVQAASCAAKLTDYRIDLVVSSPFARCLETSAQILVQLGLDLDHLIVDGQVSEVLSL